MSFLLKKIHRYFHDWTVSIPSGIWMAGKCKVDWFLRISHLSLQHLGIMQRGLKNLNTFLNFNMSIVLKILSQLGYRGSKTSLFSSQSKYMSRREVFMYQTQKDPEMY